MVLAKEVLLLCLFSVSSWGFNWKLLHTRESDSCFSTEFLFWYINQTQSKVLDGLNQPETKDRNWEQSDLEWRMMRTLYQVFDHLDRVLSWWTMKESLLLSMISIFRWSLYYGCRTSEEVTRVANKSICRSLKFMFKSVKLGVWRVWMCTSSQSHTHTQRYCVKSSDFLNNVV